MNKEIRQILKNQVTILMALADIKEVDINTIKSIKERLIATKEVLFPKEDVPYENSLKEGCGKGFSFKVDDEFHERRCGSRLKGKITLCPECEFAKSSINEKGVEKNE